MAQQTFINGQTTNDISFLDRGLQYGDGLFETIAVDKGLLLCFDDHLTRLEKGCQRLKIPFPDITILKDEAASLIGSVDRGVIKIIITRGQGGRGYSLPEHTEPSRIISLFPWPEYPSENSSAGINLRVCEYRYAKNSSLAGIKHLNRLEQVLARTEWSDDSIAEGLVLDKEHNVIEGTMSNLFYISNHTLYTPDLSLCGVEGIVRNKIIKLATELALDVEIKNLSLETLMNADEVFVCNSIIGLWAVKSIDKNLFSLGEKTQQIKQLLKKQLAISSLC